MSAKNNHFLLSVSSLSVAIGDLQVLHGINLDMGIGEVHALMGANGSGKSSLAQTLMGDPRYHVLDPQGVVTFGGKNLLTMRVDERAKAGLYACWQTPVTIPGVTVFSLCKASYESLGKTIGKLTEFKQELEALAVRVGLTKEYVSRSVNDGFSGGEKKRLELLQLLLLEPKLVILDEIDSGLDSAGVQLVTQIIAEMKAKGTSFLLITHNKRLLDEVAVDKTWEMQHGRLSAGI